MVVIGVYTQVDIYIYISSQSDAISLRLKAKYKNVANFLIMFLFSHDSNRASLNELGWL